MWSWWKSKISGEVPLIYNPSDELLLKFIRFMKKSDFKDELTLEKVGLDSDIQRNILKNINFFKPMTYLIEGEFLKEDGQLIEIRLATTSPLHAAYLKQIKLRNSTSKLAEKWTIIHTHLSSFPYSEIHSKTSSFAIVDEVKCEMWLVGSFHPTELSKILNFLHIKTAKPEARNMLTNQELQSWS